ncbi:MAG: FHA domain-containing protein [Methylococcaceae bacterium]
MRDDKTVIKFPGAFHKEADSDRTVLLKAWLRVSVKDAEGKPSNEYYFTQGFTAGRSRENDVVIKNGQISRRHLEVTLENGDWWIKDLNSANGIYIKNRRVKQKSKLIFPVSVLLGNSGVTLTIQVIEQKAELEKQAGPQFATAASTNRITQKNLSQDIIKARLLAKDEAEDAGDYTRMVRKLIHEDRLSQVRKYNKMLWALGGLFLLSVGLAAYQQIALSNARSLAIDMFYDIKTLEVSLSKSEIMINESTEVLEQALKAMVSETLKAEQERIKAEQEKITEEKKRVALEKKKLKRMKAKYREYVKEAASFRLRFPTDASYEEELITKVAHGFGESELELPEGFIEEVRRYIKYWQATSRIQHAMARFEANNYAPEVISALDEEELPLHFLYLPLQESNYDTQAIGPETPHGIAKGAWQFLATTGQQYGLTAGPLADVREYDEKDARFDFKLSTHAAAKYLKHIYSTEAQASGLLVMASYNYGHNRVRDMIKRMPDDPRDKNFWKFIQHYEIPKETYDYVFYIFSAAVIGEDPRHFGFKFDPPLLSPPLKAKGPHDKL